MTKQIAVLDQIWQEKDADSYSFLNPPFTSAEFKEFSALTKKTLPLPYRKLFKWKGGQSALTSRVFLPGWRLMQFTEIMMDYRATLELYEMGEFKQTDWWHPEWLPLLVNEEGKTLCYDAMGCFGGKPGQVIQYAMDDPERSIWFPNLVTLIDAAKNCLMNGEEYLFPKGYPISHQVR